MNPHLSFVTLLLSVITFAPVVLGQQVTCTCTAPDKSCTPRASCQRGCTALCGSKDACYAGCASGEADKSYARITLDLKEKTSEEIAATLTEHSGRRIKFTPRKKTDKTFSIQLKDDPVWEALRILAKRGKVSVDGWDFEKLQDLRRKTVKGERVSVNFTNVPVKEAVARLAFVTGLPSRIVSGDAEHLLSITIQEVTLDEIVGSISKKAGVRIEKAEKRASIK